MEPTQEVLECGCIMERIDVNGCEKNFVVEACQEHDTEFDEFEPTPFFKKFRKGVTDYA